MNALASLSSALIAGVSPMEASAQIACEYEIVATIQGPNCGITGIQGLIPTAISPNGLYVTGWQSQCEIDYNAFIWVGPPPGTRITIPRPSGVFSAKGADVNDDGVVVGTCRFSSGGNDRGFVWKYQTGEWITLEPPQSQMWIVPTAINNAGTVVGYRSIRNDVVPREAFIWNESTGFQGLGVLIGPSSGAYDISENGIVVGWTGSHNGHAFHNGARAVVWENNNPLILGPIPGGFSSVAERVNSSGDVIVEGKTQSSPVEYGQFIYNQGTWSPVVVPAGFDWAAVYGLSDSGLFAGDCGVDGSSSSPACVTAGSQSVVLEGSITPPIVNFGLPNYAAGVSEDGLVLLAGRRTNGTETGFVLQRLPNYPGDSNCDNHVDIDDLLNVINSWGRCDGCPTDFNQSQTVDIDDLLTVINQWSP